MKKTVPVKRRKSPTPIRPEKDSAAKQVDFALVRANIQNAVARDAVAMVEATISSATDGQYAAMKYLFELVGLFPAIPNQTQSDDSLARTLLNRIGLLESSSSSSAATKELSKSTNLFINHAIE